MMFYSFQCIRLVYLLSDLFLRISYFYAIVNGIAFLIFISDYLLLAYRHKPDICILSLHAETS